MTNTIEATGSTQDVQEDRKDLYRFINPTKLKPPAIKVPAQIQARKLNRLQLVLYRWLKITPFPPHY